jgi:hypothetical protein
VHPPLALELLAAIGTSVARGFAQNTEISPSETPTGLISLRQYSTIIKATPHYPAEAPGLNEQRQPLTPEYP